MNLVRRLLEVSDERTEGKAVISTSKPFFRVQAQQVFHVSQRANQASCSKVIGDSLYRFVWGGVRCGCSRSTHHLFLGSVPTEERPAPLVNSDVLQLFAALCATASYQGDPEDDVLVDKTVEVLVEEEETGPDEGCVGQVQLTLGHVGHLKAQPAQC